MTTFMTTPQIGLLLFLFFDKIAHATISCLTLVYWCLLRYVFRSTISSIPMRENVIYYFINVNFILPITAAEVAEPNHVYSRIAAEQNRTQEIRVLSHL